MRPAKRCEGCRNLRNGNCGITDIEVVNFNPVYNFCPLEFYPPPRDKHHLYRNRIYLCVEYLVKRKSLYLIGLENKVGDMTIAKWIKRHKIPIRAFGRR
jgi:hypothetical protein